ncbi:MAG: coproporphyrinogen III oxidase, partial [Deltaproteobacteria bacterium]|nr:coproporphyrinogen III oxidase [Deltaproteobacteria bacterium]
RHNLNYWQYGEYLGLGSGAVSFVDRKRWTTTRNVGRYLQGDFEPKDLDAIDQKTAMGEFCFMGLRTRDGISTEEFAQRFKIPLKSVFPGIFEELARHELVVQQGSRVELTDRGIELSNEVFRRLVG